MAETDTLGYTNDTISKGNVAYIDGQNLYMGTAKSSPQWHIDLARFRTYLAQKYHVEHAYYYLGYIQEGENIESLYDAIQAAGFILRFRLHNSAMLGKKKGDVDSDIAFATMKSLHVGDTFDKIVLVSGDGDYKMLVDFLIEHKRFEKLLFPNSKYRSSLYRKLEPKYYDSLDSPAIQAKIALKKR